jgi:hypothetical protein
MNRGSEIRDEKRTKPAQTAGLVRFDQPECFGWLAKGDTRYHDVTIPSNS